MPDAIFEHPRLAAIYDDLDPDRSDLETYRAIVREVGARSVLDVGCGTGTFALMLADAGLRVVGVDPAAGSLAVARGKRGSERVRWVHGGADAAIGRGIELAVDLATMTGNVAQAIAEPAEWDLTLRSVHEALRPGGRLVFESRVPAARGWEVWTKDLTHDVTEIPGVGAVETWTELTEVALPLVAFRSVNVFHADGAMIESTSTLRFRSREEIEADLDCHGFVVDEVREAPDRPGKEMVFLARRTG